MEKKEMTPREFALWWQDKIVGSPEFVEYEEAQSEEEKRLLLKKWEIPDMYEEAERQLWLEKILEDYVQEELEKRAPRNEKECDERFNQFDLYLRSLELRDYEWGLLMTRYVRGLALDAVLEDTCPREIPQDVKEEFEKLGILERIGVIA